MSNPSAIRTASTSRLTLSTFTLRTDAVTYFSLMVISDKSANIRSSPRAHRMSKGKSNSLLEK